MCMYFNLLNEVPGICAIILQGPHESDLMKESVKPRWASLHYLMRSNLNIMGGTGHD